MNPAATYILNQPEPYKSILMHLQLTIEKIVPTVELKFKYKIPFYYVDGHPFCYLNQTKDFVDVGFWKAAHLTVHQEHLIAEHRKVIKSLRYYSLQEIDTRVLEEVLLNAYEVRNKKFYS